MKKITAITIIALFLFFDNIQAQQRYGKCYQKTALPEGVTHQDLFTPLLQKIPAGAYASAGVYLVEVPCDSYVGNNYFTVDTAHIETEKKYWVPKQNHDQFMITGNGSHRSGNPCAAISDLITDMINTMDTTFSSPEQMGALAADSIS